MAPTPCFKCSHFVLEKQGCRLFAGPIWTHRTKTGKCGTNGIYFKETPLHKSCWDCRYYNNVDDVCKLFSKEPSWYARSGDGHCGPDGFFFLDNQTSDYIRTHHHVVDQ